MSQLGVNRMDHVKFRSGAHFVACQKGNPVLKYPSMKRHSLTPVAFAITTLALSCASTHAEFVVSMFTGTAMTGNNDLHLNQPNESLTFHNVSYEGKDFSPPLYYGGRLAYYLDRDRSGFGFGLEFFHAKAYLNANDTVQVTGTRNGAPVNDQEPISNTIQFFNNSHGLNFALADVLYRFVFNHRDESLLGRVQPYLGAGIGAVIPHVESEVNGVEAEEYQLHGPGVEALAGVNIDIVRHFSIFGEYKFTYADLTESIPGGSIHFEPETSHIVGGISVSF